MKKSTGFVIGMIALFCSGFTDEGTWVIGSESKLTIYGTTNVNSFACEVESFSGHDTLHFFENSKSSEIQIQTNRMTIPIKHFDCDSKQISRDFKRTLKSDAYPVLGISFIYLENLAIKNNSLVNGIIDISLAGVKTRYKIEFAMDVKNGTTVLTGIHQVNFSDFNLKAPEKLKGLVRVNEVLKVEFHLVLKSA